MARIRGSPSDSHTGTSVTPPTIMIRFNIAGARAGTANSPRALSIPITAAARATAGRNGSITRVSSTVRSIFPGTEAKPGANSVTSHGASSAPARHTSSNTKSSVISSWRPRAQAAASPPWLWVSVNVGTNADDIAPSANRSRSKLGIRKATLNASVANPAPNNVAMTCSRARPSRRDRNVAAPTVPAWRATLSSSLIPRRSRLARLGRAC